MGLPMQLSDNCRRNHGRLLRGAYFNRRSLRPYRRVEPPARGPASWRFHRGVGYRHLMTFKGDCDVETTPPHDILTQPIDQHLPIGEGADFLRTLIARSTAILQNHDVNNV